MQQVYNPISGFFDLVGGGVTGSGTLNFLAKFTPTGISLGSSILYDNGLNVGVGTNTPGFKLDVAGNINNTTGYYQDGVKILHEMKQVSTRSIALGQNAGNTTATAQYVYAIGYGALTSITTGDEIIGIGHNALSSNTSGKFNVAVGSYSLQSLVGAFDQNTAVGYGSLSSLTSGEFNVAIGHNAMNSATAVNGNIAVGRHAGFALTTVSGVTIVGYNAFRSQTNNAGQTVAIGTYALELENGGTGNNTAVGFACASNITSAVEWTALGAYALYNSTGGQRQLAIGTEALRFSNGDFNFGIGRRAGYDVTTGTQNVFIGNNVGGGLISGSNNVIIGGMISALPAAMTNAIIMADGNGAKFLSNNYGNATDVIIGLNSNLHTLGNTIGTMTIVGSQNGATWVGGASNYFTILGYNNFNNITNGVGCIAIGNGISFSGAGVYNHSIGIGSDVTLNASNQMVVGSAFASIDNIYLGHGIANPDAVLWYGNAVIGNPGSGSIANTINLGLTKRIAFDGIRALSYDLVSDGIRISGGATAGRIIFTDNGSTEVARFDAGALGINTTTPAGKFDVNGNVYFRNTTYVDTIESIYFPGATKIVMGSGVFAQSRGEIGLAYSTFTIDTPNQVTTTGAKIMSVNNNAVEYFNIDKDGNIKTPFVQTGNAGLVTGQLYKDTAANILANGDLVIGIKV